jgi:hypothetical protein
MEIQARASGGYPRPERKSRRCECDYLGDRHRGHRRNHAGAVITEAQRPTIRTVRRQISKAIADLSPPASKALQEAQERLPRDRTEHAQEK